MRKFIILLFFLSLASSSFATEFKLTSFNRYGPAPSMELGLYPENANTLDEIFKVLKFSNNELYVRLIGGSSEKTNQELLNFYHKEMPYLKGELNKEPMVVKRLFVNALRSTTLFKTLKMKLDEAGFKIENISFEKLGFGKDRISIPDVYITCVKKPNKTN